MVVQDLDPSLQLKPNPDPGKDFMPKTEQFSVEKRQSLTFKDFHAPGEAYSSSKH
jgi:hypothetical protein